MAGFRRPHRDFEAHQTYWDLYPDQSKMHIARHQRRDPSQPEVAFHAAGCTLPNGTTIPGDADSPWPLEVQQWFKTGCAAWPNPVRPRTRTRARAAQVLRGRVADRRAGAQSMA
jgi:hypothetical protein